MKKLNFLSLFVLLLLIGACEQSMTREGEEQPIVPEEEQEEFEDPEVVMRDWEEAWTGNNVEELRNQTADDAVLVLNGREVVQDSITAFLEGAGAVMKDLQMQSLGSGSTDRMVYDTGTYQHTYTDDTTTYRGSYTFIWERPEGEQEWQVAIMNISGENELEEEEL